MKPPVMTTLAAAATTAAAAATTTNPVSKVTSIYLPYFGGITEPLVRHLQQVGISATVKTRGTLREQLVHPKDKLEKININGVVYYHACAGSNNVPCTDNYVGESARAASTRNAEHFSTAQSAPGLYKSAIMQHAADSQHHFRKEDIKILSRDDNWHTRGIRESIYIRGLSPTLNRNDGRHTLPHCYDNIIKKTVKKPESPVTHQPTETRLSTNKRPPGRPRVNPSVTEIITVPKTIEPPRQPPSHTMTTRSRRAPTQGDRGLT